MSVQFVAITLLACMVAVHAANLRNLYDTEMVPLERESRILVVPTLGDVIYIGLKSIWFLVSSAWSFIGYKLTAITLVANIAIWIAHNCFSAILGAAVTLAFCKLSGKCSLDYAEEKLSELSAAAKHLADGTEKFSR